MRKNKIKLSNLKYFKQGVSNLTPEQQVNVTKVSSLGQLVGFSIAELSMVFGLWYKFSWTTFGFGIVLMFAILMNLMQYNNSVKQEQMIKDQKQQMEMKNQPNL